MNPPTNKGKTFPREPLTREEVRALLATMSTRWPTGVRNRALVAVFYGSGVRVAEALALRPVDINVEEGIVQVLHGKGDKARTIGIDDGSLIHIDRWLHVRRGLRIRGGPLLCTVQGVKGNPLKQRDVRFMLQQAALEAGIEKRVHPHGFRHTFAVELEKEGFTVSEIQKLLGHESLQTTATYLDHLSPSRLIEKVRRRRQEI